MSKMKLNNVAKNQFQFADKN